MSPPKAVSVLRPVRLASTRRPSLSVTTPSSSFPCFSSSEFLRFCSSLGPPFGPSFTLPTGFSPSSRLHFGAATFREGSHALATVRPQAFSTSRRFSPRPSSQAYFIPLPRPGSLPFRGFSPRAATLPHRKELAPVSLLHRRFARRYFRGTDVLPLFDAPRLRGFYPRKAAFHESGYSPRPQPLPSSVSSPPGSFLSRRRRRITQRVPLLVFSRRGLHFHELLERPLARSSSLLTLVLTVLVHLQRLLIESVLDARSPSHPTCSSFQTFHPRLPRASAFAFAWACTKRRLALPPGLAQGPAFASSCTRTHPLA